MTSKVQNFSCENKTSLSGAKGLGTLTVSFRDISSVKFSDNATNVARAEIKFWDGREVSLLVKDYYRCKGQTEEGALNIRIRDIRDIAFERPSQTNPSITSE